MLWTDALLDEWEDVIVREQQRSPDTAANLTAAVREFFASDKIERAEYGHLINTMPGEDPDDHEHMAAAIARQPCTLLTNNRDDFPAKQLHQRGVRVLGPDEYLCDLIDEWPRSPQAIPRRSPCRPGRHHSLRTPLPTSRTRATKKCYAPTIAVSTGRSALERDEPSKHLGC